MNFQLILFCFVKYVWSVGKRFRRQTQGLLFVKKLTKIYSTRIYVWVLRLFQLGQYLQ